ncbi:hypothetical protein M758_11G011000 [Ceratodon purpureus]|nr:hypothetical protein M758_11G011000 [Ceratodon purpureus]
MGVIEQTKLRVEGEIMIMHEGQAEQNGSRRMVDKVACSLLQEEIESSLFTPQYDEVSQVVEIASAEVSPQAPLKSDASVVEEKASPVLDSLEETRSVEIFTASNMRIESGIHTRDQEGEADDVRTESGEIKYAECSRIARKLSRSEEASVDVHSEDSEKAQDTTRDFLKTVSNVDLALLQKNSEEFAGSPQEVDTEPTLAAKWSHEVSVDVIPPDDWVEAEAEAETRAEVPASGIAPSFESGKPSPSGLVDVEPVSSNLTTEYEFPSAIAIELENQGRELISESQLDVEGPISGTLEREMASPNSIGTQSSFEKRESVYLPEQPPPHSVEWESYHSIESETTTQEFQGLPIQVGEASQDTVPTSTQDEDINFRVCPSPLTGAEADESIVSEFVQPTELEKLNVAESSPCSPESPEMADVEVACERTTDMDSNIQDESHVVSTPRVPSFAGRERVIEVDAGTTEAMVEELESTSAPPEQSEGVAEIEEQVQSLWSLKNLKKRPLVKPRSADEQAVRPREPKAPKVVGLPWPPMPLICAEDKHCMDIDDAFTAPGQSVAESVGATDTIVAEPKEVLNLESASPPSEQSEGMDGVESSIKEQHLRRLWSLQYLKTRPVMLGPSTVTQVSVRSVEQRAPKVVGLPWPPTPLTFAEDKHCMDTDDALKSPGQSVADSAGATDSVVAEAKEELIRLESASSPSEQSEGMDAVESSTKEQHLRRLWSLQYLKTRPVMLEPTTVTQVSVKTLELKAPKVVGLPWPPMPLTTADNMHSVDTDDAFTTAGQSVAESAGPTDTIVAVPKEEVIYLESASSPSEESEGMDGLEANMNEQHLRRLWSLQYLKTRPVMLEPTTVTQVSVKSMELKAPKVIGLPWPPTPYTSAEYNDNVDTAIAFRSPEQSVAESVGATDVIVRVAVEPVNTNLTTEHEAPSSIRAMELEKQGRELISESLDIEGPISGTSEREMTSPNSIGTQSSFEKRDSVYLPEQPPPHFVQWESYHSNESETTTQELQGLPIQVGEDEDMNFRVCPSPLTGGEADESIVSESVRPIHVERINVAESSPCTSQSPVMADVEVTCARTTDLSSNIQDERHVVSTARVPSFAGRERVIEVDAGTTEAMVEELESTSAPPEQSEGVAEIEEQVQSLWSLKNLKKRPLVKPRSAAEQAVRPREPKAPKVVGLPWPPMPLICAVDKHCMDIDDAFTAPGQSVAESVGATDTIVAESKEVLNLESASPPSEQSEGTDGVEANIKEQHLRRLWSLQYLKTRPVMLGPSTVTQVSVRSVEQRAPKVVGLPWPPTPLTFAEDKHCMDTDDALKSPGQSVADSAGATDSVVAEAKEELIRLESASSPSEQSEGMDGVESSIKEQHLRRLWSMQYLKTRPVMLEPSTVTQLSLKSGKLKAPKVVGLSWPPAPFSTSPGINGVFT